MALFEEARWDFITARGYGLKDFQKYQQGPVILEANLKFKRELPNREKIEIVSQLQEVKPKILTLKQTILKEDKKVSCEALYVIGFMDLKLRKLVSLPDIWLKAVGAK